MEKRKNQKEKVIRFFDECAATYYKKRYIESTLEAHNFCTRKNLVLNMLKKNNWRILNIGCGPGVMSKELSQKGYNLVELDISKKMVKEAIKKSKQLKIKNMPLFFVGDIENLCFLDSQFDAIICLGTLQLVNDKKAIKEMYRVLKPGGTIIIAVPTKRVISSFLKIIINPLKPLIYKIIKRERIITNFKNKGYNPWQLDILFAKNGFKKVDYFYHHFVFFPIDELFPSFSIKFDKKIRKILLKSNLVGRLLGKTYIVKLIKSK